MRDDLQALWDLHKKPIMERLQRVIPKPKPPVAKPTLSFRGLKPGMEVESVEGSRYKIILVDSLHAEGVKVLPLATDQMVMEYLSFGVDWSKSYVKIPKRRVKKVATEGSQE